MHPELEEEVVHGTRTVDLDLAVWVAESDLHDPQANVPSRGGTVTATDG